jgi:hypothetical protein
VPREQSALEQQVLVDLRMSPHAPVKASEAEITSTGLPISDD